MKPIVLAAFILILSLNVFAQKYNGILIDGDLLTFVDTLTKKLEYRLIDHTDSTARILSTENDTIYIRSKNSKVYTVISMLKKDDVDNAFTRFSNFLSSFYGVKGIEDGTSIFFDVKNQNLYIKLSIKDEYLELIYENKLNL
jgi:hypothetical protein